MSIKNAYCPHPILGLIIFGLPMLFSYNSATVSIGNFDSAALISENLSEAVPMTQPEYPQHYYQSVSELIEAINGFKEEEYRYEFDPHHIDNDDVLQKIGAFIAKIRTDGLPVPYYNGKEITLYGREDSYNIELHPVYGFNAQPNIQYSVRQQEDFYAGDFSDYIGIQFVYLDKKIKAEANEKGALWVVEQYDPKDPETGKLLNFNYPVIFEKNIVLQNRTVKALFLAADYQITTSSYQAYFAYDSKKSGGLTKS